MGEGRFESRRLQVDHVVDQSGLVKGNPEKAWLMAEEEQLHRDFLKLYREYCADSEKFIAAHPRLSEAHLTTLKRLAEQKVPAEYIHRYGELRAEVIGEVFDFRERVRKLDEEGLHSMRESLSVAVEAGVLLGGTLRPASHMKYELDAYQLNHWLRIIADAMKFEVAGAEIARRSAQNNGARK